MRLPAAALLLLLACDGKACDVPTAPDAKPLVGRGESCQSVWDCQIGLTCTANRCESPSEDPYPCYYDSHCPASWPPLECVNNYCVPADLEPDASVPDDSDASLPDAATSDASTSDASTSDAGTTDASTLDASEPAGFE